MGCIMYRANLLSLDFTCYPRESECVALCASSLCPVVINQTIHTLGIQLVEGEDTRCVAAVGAVMCI